ncbi:MAG: hypothetical protein IT449_13485 [Phycisphaerales bacterium]|nr:hypothetical protein [Phycisphaerales bacterium]
MDAAAPVPPSGSTDAPSASPAAPSPVSDRAVAVVVWISALLLLTPVLIFVYVYWIRNRLLGD